MSGRRHGVGGIYGGGLFLCRVRGSVVHAPRRPGRIHPDTRSWYLCFRRAHRCVRNHCDMGLHSQNEISEHNAAYQGHRDWFGYGGGGGGDSHHGTAPNVGVPWSRIAYDRTSISAVDVRHSAHSVCCHDSKFLASRRDTARRDRFIRHTKEAGGKHGTYDWRDLTHDRISVCNSALRLPVGRQRCRRHLRR